MLTMFPMISITVAVSLYSGYADEVISSVTMAASKILSLLSVDWYFRFSEICLARQKTLINNGKEKYSNRG